MKHKPNDTVVATVDIKMMLLETEMTFAYAGERLVILDGGPLVWRVAKQNDLDQGFHCQDNQIRAL